VFEKMPEVVQQEMPQDTPSAMIPSYTAAEVSTHATKDDCWLILDNGVYDVTSFIPSHPGGDKILRGCGQDATAMFSQHPESAKALKEQFKIGELVQ
jgi:cytochrome b involved in lipid metabolism